MGVTRGGRCGVRFHCPGCSMVCVNYVVTGTSGAQPPKRLSSRVSPAAWAELAAAAAPLFSGRDEQSARRHELPSTCRSLAASLGGRHRTAGLLAA